MDYPAANCKTVSSIRIEIHLIVPDPPGGVLARTNENASGASVATGLIPATGTLKKDAEIEKISCT